MTTNTKTLLTVKIDKVLKKSAQQVAETIGIPLGTLVNSMLKQMVRNKEVNLYISYQPSKSLIESLKQAEKEIAAGDYEVSHSVEELMQSLNSL